MTIMDWIVLAVLLGIPFSIGAFVFWRELMAPDYKIEVVVGRDHALWYLVTSRTWSIWPGEAFSSPEDAKQWISAARQAEATAKAAQMEINRGRT